MLCIFIIFRSSISFFSFVLSFFILSIYSIFSPFYFFLLFPSFICISSLLLIIIFFISILKNHSAYTDLLSLYIFQSVYRSIYLPSIIPFVLPSIIRFISFLFLSAALLSSLFIPFIPICFSYLLHFPLSFPCSSLFRSIMISLSNLLLFIPSVHLPFIFSMFIFFSAFFSSLSYLSFLSFCSLPFPPKMSSPLSSLSLSFTSLCLHSFIFSFYLFPILFPLSILPSHSPFSFPSPVHSSSFTPPSNPPP